MRSAGERAIVDWLAEKILGIDQAVMVLCENGRPPRIIANQGMDATIDVVTTRGFLGLVEQGGGPRAADLWARIVAEAPSANNAQTTTLQRRHNLP